MSVAADGEEDVGSGAGVDDVACLDAHLVDAFIGPRATRLHLGLLGAAQLEFPLEVVAEVWVVYGVVCGHGRATSRAAAGQGVAARG